MSLEHGNANELYAVGYPLNQVCNTFFFFFLSFSLLGMLKTNELLVYMSVYVRRFGCTMHGLDVVYLLLTAKFTKEKGWKKSLQLLLIGRRWPAPLSSFWLSVAVAIITIQRRFFADWCVCEIFFFSPVLCVRSCSLSYFLFPFVFQNNILL